MLYAVVLGRADFWTELGLRADAVIGHSPAARAWIEGTSTINTTTQGPLPHYYEPTTAG